MAAKETIDLNCDLGEGYPHDQEIFPVISSANIACGGHAGDKKSITTCLDLCERYNVAAGAHPSYPDKENFGRASMKLTELELQNALKRQLDLFYETALQSNISVHHVKLHGALYNDCSFNEELSSLVIEWLKEYGVRMVYGAGGSIFNRIAREKGIIAIDEVFADRSYLPGGMLAPRNRPGALISDPAAVKDQLTSLMTREEVITMAGDKMNLRADTICLHGDSPGAAGFIHLIRDLLKNLNIAVATP